MSTWQKTLFGLLLAAAVAAFLFERQQAQRAEAETESLRAQPAPPDPRLPELLAERDAATNQVAGLKRELADRRGDQLRMLKLRAELTHWRQMAAAVPAPPATPAPVAEAAEPWDMTNAREVKTSDRTLNFTNGVAVVRTSADPTEATAQDTYTIGRLLAADDRHSYYEVSLNSGGSGDDVALGIFTTDTSGSGRNLQLLSVGDRVQIYNLEQRSDQVDVYYLDRPAGTAMTQPPNLPTRTTFQPDPSTGQYVPVATYVVDTQQAWVKKL